MQPPNCIWYYRIHIKEDIAMEMRFKEAAAAFLSSGKRLQPFRPFPPASCREAYDPLPSWLRQKVLALGKDCLGFPYPMLRATDFMSFRRTGNRVDYEKLYFSRRYALNSLVAAECVENKSRFLDDIINGIFALCEESAWQLPPHNSYGRGSSQEILPDHTRPILDLFACETGAQLACIYYLLKEQLNAVSPYITKRICSELTRRIVIPYLQEHFWWMGCGKEPMCNWTPWCTQNVLLTVFLCADTPTGQAVLLTDTTEPTSGFPTPTEQPALLTDISNTASDLLTSAELPGLSEGLLRAILKKAAESCDYFLKDYGEDGCCDEGAQYYRHAGLCLDGAATVLNHVTGGAFAELMKWEKVKNIASYILHVHVSDKYYFNFADCSPIAGRAGVREYLFGKHTEQPELMQFAAEDFRAARDAMFDDESHQLNLFYRLQAMFCYDEIMTFSSAAPPVCRDLFYPSVGLFLVRNSVFCLAVKAGDNNDNHNHNDVGSITLYKNGKPILVDIGVESYTRKTFSPDRYKIWTMQSGFHNLPTIEDTDQHDGADYRAENVVTSFGDLSVISMELSGAYPLPGPKRSYVRRVAFDKRANCITLTDRTDSRNVIQNLITCEKPQLTDNTLKLGEATLLFQGASLWAVEVLPITDQRLQTAWEHDLYRIRLKMQGPEFKMKIF